MGFKPDYGLRLIQEGMSPAISIFFDDFHMFSLIVLGPGEYSTVVDTMYQGERHAVSLNFNRAQLERILTMADSHLVQFLRAELSRDPVSLRSIDLDGPLVFGVRARLGQLQTAAKEQFVPLIAQEILPLFGARHLGHSRRPEGCGVLSEQVITHADDPVIVVVSRDEVEARDASSVIGVLKSCLTSSERALNLFEKIDIAFHGYDRDTRELFEILEVRDYVRLLDDAFPYWLFFLTKSGLGLQAIALCLIPPYLTEPARKTVFGQVLSNRWFPAMIHICEVVGFSEEQIEALMDDVANYFIEGPHSLQA